MRWLIILLFSMLPTISMAQTVGLAHTGVICKDIQTLKKEHPSQHIYWETINGAKCYHVHALPQIKKNVGRTTIPQDVTSHLKNREMCFLFPFSDKMWCPLFDINTVQDWYYDHARDRDKRRE